MSHQKIDIRVRDLEAKGYSVLERSDTSATLVRDGKVKHWLHLLLTLGTSGLWLPFYLWRVGSVNSKVHLEIEGTDVLREKQSGNKSKSFSALGAVPIVALLFYGSTLPSVPGGNESGPFEGSTSQLDEACRAMKAADLTLATVGKSYYDGRAISQAQLDSLRASEENINNTYKATSGAFYSYMVGQANNLYLVRINLAARDFAVAEMAIDAYLDNDRYTQFCN